MWVRTFNENGMNRFRSHLEGYQEGKTLIEDFEDLTRLPSLSNILEPRVEINIPRLSNKKELATLICTQFTKAGFDVLPTRNTSYNRGIWTWLAAASFHLIRPRRMWNGKPSLRDHSYYILSEHGLRYYRHRIAGPARIYWWFRDKPREARLFLNSEIDQVSEFEERLAVTMRYMSNRELMKVADALYFDTKTFRQKRGSVSDASRPGVLRRFMTVIDQLDRTYDLHSMTAEQILGLLPHEFDRWKPKPESILL